jgi:hypothetical protein
VNEWFCEAFGKLLSHATPRNRRHIHAAEEDLRRETSRILAQQSKPGDDAAFDLRTQLRTRTVVFCGYSLRDPVIHTFRTVYEEMARARRDHGGNRMDKVDLTAHPNYLRFHFRGTGGFPDIDELFRWLYHESEAIGRLVCRDAKQPARHRAGIGRAGGEVIIFPFDGEELMKLANKRFTRPLRPEE